MSERKIVVTLKAGPGYEAPWITIGGDSMEEVDFQLDALASSSVAMKMVALSADIRADYKDARHAEQSQPTQPAQPQYTNPRQQAAAQSWDDSFSAPEPPQDPWASQSNVPQDPWAGTSSTPPPAQQTQAQQGPAPVCGCGQTAEPKVTNNGKHVWRCPDWRWNNGNPNNHLQKWA